MIYYSKKCRNRQLYFIVSPIAGLKKALLHDCAATAFLQRLFYIICLLFEDITLLTCPITVITVITVIRTVAADSPVQAWPVQTEPERCFWCSYIISLAISTSRIRDSAEVMFSVVTPRLLMVCSRRFWIAPSLPRLVDTVLMAVFDFAHGCGSAVSGADVNIIKIQSIYMHISNA